jgi:hypothetical protein
LGRLVRPVTLFRLPSVSRSERVWLSGHVVLGVPRLLSGPAALFAARVGVGAGGFVGSGLLLPVVGVAVVGCHVRFRLRDSANKPARPFTSFAPLAGDSTRRYGDEEG